MPKWELRTVRKYDFYDCASAMQKAIRRGDARVAGYFAIELCESNYWEYTWRRLLTVSAEDCWGILTQEVWSLFESWRFINVKKKGAGRIFVAKAVILLAQCKKSRDADHLTNLVYDAKEVSQEEIDGFIDEARENKEEIPEYAYDCHTFKGKMKGMTKDQFFQTEQDALVNRSPGLFDDLV